MGIIPEFSSAEDLMRKVATDETVVRNLASFAHVLGFGWCGGTRSQNVGEDFDVILDRDTVIVKAHYDPKDPYADGYMAHERLKMTFRNFRLDINTAEFRYAAPRITSRETLGLASVWARNASSVEDTVTQSFTFATTEAVTHSAGAKISSSAGVKVSASGGASVPFVADGKVTAEASLVVTAEGTYGLSKSRSTTTTHTANYTGRLKPMTQRLLKLSVTKAEADVDYTSEGVVLYDVTLSGFLRAGGNALRTHPTDRPMYECPLGGQAGALGWIRWLAENDQPNRSRWDLDWIRNQGWGGTLDAVLDFARQPTRARLTGSFKIAAGVDATIVGGQDTPITDGPVSQSELAEVTEAGDGVARILGVDEVPREAALSFGD